MRTVYSNKVIERIKSLYDKRGPLYNDILDLARDSRPWKEVNPNILKLCAQHYRTRYNIPNYGEFYAIEIMVLLGLTDLLREMFSAPSSTFTWLNDDRRSIASCAAWCNNTEIFKLSLSRHLIEHTRYALFYALQNGNTEIINIIYDARVNFYGSSSDLSRSCSIAHMRGHLDAIKLMILKFNLVNRLGSGLSIEHSAINNDVDFFRQVYDRNAGYGKEMLSVSIDSGCHGCQSSITPIATAAMMGSWDVVRFLFDLGVPLRTEVSRRMRDYYGDTVLHTIYNCHLPSDLKEQKPLIADIYNKLRDSLPRHEQIFFAQHFAIEDFVHILKT